MDGTIVRELQVASGGVTTETGGIGREGERERRETRRGNPNGGESQHTTYRTQIEFTQRREHQQLISRNGMAPVLFFLPRPKKVQGVLYRDVHAFKSFDLQSQSRHLLRISCTAKGANDNFENSTRRRIGRSPPFKGSKSASFIFQHFFRCL